MLAVQAVSTLIQVLLPLKDVIIAVGVAYATYFTITKLTPFFNTAIAGFQNMRLGMGKTFVDLETGSIKSGNVLKNLGQSIKNIPPVVKIAIAVAGAELAGKILSDMFDQMSKLHDESMALIIQDAENTTAKAHKLSEELRSFGESGQNMHRH